MVMGMVYWVSHITLKRVPDHLVRIYPTFKFGYGYDQQQLTIFKMDFMEIGHGLIPAILSRWALGGVVPWREHQRCQRGERCCAQRRGGFWKLSREQPKRWGKFMQKKHDWTEKLVLCAYIYINSRFSFTAGLFKIGFGNMALEIPLAIAKDRLLPLERLSGGGPKKRNPEAPIGAEAMFLGGWWMNKYMDENGREFLRFF